MFKKMIPMLMMVFVVACTNLQGTSSSTMPTPCECSEKCECCKSGSCDCCKDGNCSCCKDGMCEMCRGKMSVMSLPKEGEQHKICLKASAAQTGKN
jgi:hypothetical protein